MLISYAYVSGYLPHNGVATIEQFVESTVKGANPSEEDQHVHWLTTTVYGMGPDLATVLAVYGAVFDGDLTGWSIGGPSKITSLTGLLERPQGISYSHNKYEGDGSLTRGDLYQTGNSWLLQMPQFQAMYKLGQPADNYDLQLLTEYRYTRFQDSVKNNPYFFNAPFSGVLVQPGAAAFIYRFMANNSAE